MCSRVTIFIYKTTTTASTNAICAAATDIAHHSDFNFSCSPHMRSKIFLLVTSRHLQSVSNGKITFGVVSNIYITKLLCACTDPFLFSPFNFMKIFFPFFPSSSSAWVQTKTFFLLFLLLKIFSSVSGEKSFWIPQKERVACHSQWFLTTLWRSFS